MSVATARSEARADDAAESPALVVEGLTTSIRIERHWFDAVRDVSFDVHRRETLALVGESGCGKSLTALSVMGLLPAGVGRVTRGRIVVDGVEMTGASDAQVQAMRGDRIGMVFQEPMTSLNPVLPVGFQIAESLVEHRGMGNREARLRALELMELVRIPAAAERLDAYPHQFSGGMRQRVMIAIALACGPTLLFADEPTTALDVTVQAQILDLLNEQRKDRNMSLILVTHDLGVVAGHTDEICVMYGGQLVERAPTKVLFANMKMPYTEALMQSIPKIEDASHSRLLAIGGRPPDLVNPPQGCRFAPRCMYARDKCREEMPPLIETEVAGHFYRCWYPVGSPEYHESRARLNEIPVTVGEAS